MVDEPNGVEWVVGAISTVGEVLAGVVVVGIAVASFRSGGPAGWALGACLLALVGSSLPRWPSVIVERRGTPTEGFALERASAPCAAQICDDFRGPSGPQCLAR